MLWLTETELPRRAAASASSRASRSSCFDRNAEQRHARALTFAVPAVILIDVADVFWSPTRGIVVQGALIGSLTALFAVGIALVYRANRIVNFAQGDLGAVPAIFAILLLAKDAPGGAPDWMTGLPYPVAFVARPRRRDLPRLRRRADVHQPVLPGAAARPDRRDDRHRAAAHRARAVHARAGSGSRTSAGPTLNPPFDVKVEIGGVFFDDNDLMVFIVVPLVLVALALFMRYAQGRHRDPSGRRARRPGGDARRPGRTDPDHRVGHHRPCSPSSRCSSAPASSSFPIGSALGVTVLVRALAAAVIGRMDNFPRIAAAAIGLGIVEQAIVFDTGRDLYVFPVLFVIIVVGLLLEPEAARAAGSTTRRCRPGRPRARSGRSRPSCRSTSRSCAAPTSRSTARSSLFVAHAPAVAVEQQAR